MYEITTDSERLRVHVLVRPIERECAVRRVEPDAVVERRVVRLAREIRERGPTAGIRIRDIRVEVNLEEIRVRCVRVRAQTHVLAVAVLAVPVISKFADRNDVDAPDRAGTSPRYA